MRKLKHSQNFIKSKKLVDYLINKTGINSNDIVLEIGTGSGVITERLCRFAKYVISIEKDNRLYRFTKQNLKNFKNLKLVNEDILNYSLPMFKYKCFSNIPFNFTADIVRKLLLGSNTPVSTYLVMQKESSERFVGKLKSTQISLILSPLYSVNIIYEFRKEDFYPIPSVQVVFVSFKKRSPPDICPEEYNFYKDFISFSFNQWNESIKKTLLNIITYKQLKKLSKSLDFDMKDKPSKLEYEKWLKLFQFIQSHPDQTKINKFFGYYKLHYDIHKHHKPVYRTSIRR